MKKGFTLIELVIVIVILGILAAVAIPKFADLQKDAKVSAVKGLGGSISAAKDIVRAKWLAQDNVSSDNVTIEGKTVKVYANDTTNSYRNGYPIASNDGILNAISYDNKTYEIDNTTTNKLTFYYKGFKGATNNKCYAEYDATSNTESPKVVIETTDCQ
ncbi:type IV pilin protein [Calditerrivibrio sp.]|uniref:type IV pilin protein n=1 Tax=Calditerrivibrio sp. TaxID=2792612 RepID=UPI003D151198